MKAPLSELARALGRPLPGGQLNALARFGELVKTWNARTNLTAARTPEALAEVFFADALVLAEEDLVPRGSSLVDVGTGGGAPAIPLLLLRDDLGATLVEPLRKRVTFLRTAIGSLGLGRRVRVVEGRIDPDRPEVDGAPFDVALSRATLAPAEWLRAGLGLGRRVLVLTAAEAPPDAPEGARVAVHRDYQLPREGAPRRITAYERTAG